MRNVALFAGALALALLTHVAVPADAEAVYAIDKCVAGKQKALSKYCKSLFKAHSTFQKDPLKDGAASDRDTDLMDAADDFVEAYGKAETKSLDKGVDCSESSESDADLAADLEADVSSIVGDVAADQDTGDSGDLKCRAKVLKNAAKLCGSLLKAESKHIKKRSSDPLRESLAENRSDARQKFIDGLPKLADCVDNDLRATDHLIAGHVIADTLDAAADRIALDTTTIPEGAIETVMWSEIPVPDLVEYSETKLSPLEPICAKGGDYRMWARRGTVNKLVVYYQGGGACWDTTTCGFGVCDSSVEDGDSPNLVTTGLASPDNPENPFKDWHAIFIPYCTCDVHWGTMPFPRNYPKDGPIGASQIWHSGRINALVAEKWLREHFVNPEEIFITGSSAGSYGAGLNGTHLHEVYPSSRISILGDAGNGVITADFLENNIENWFTDDRPIDLPRHIPALNVKELRDLDWASTIVEAARFYEDRNSLFALYTTNWDWNQTLFFNASIQSAADLANWRLSSCGWNDSMLYLNDIMLDAGLPNVRTYIGPGSDHTVFGNDKMYTETIATADESSTVRLIDWITDMSAFPPGPNWVNAQCKGGDCDHVCSPDPVFGVTCDDPGEHQDESTAPLPDCDGDDADIQACCFSLGDCEDLESSFCRFRAGSPLGVGTECATSCGN